MSDADIVRDFIRRHTGKLIGYGADEALAALARMEDEVERLRRERDMFVEARALDLAEVERLRAALESTECPTPVQRDGGGFIACGACPRCQALEGSTSEARG